MLYYSQHKFNQLLTLIKNRHRGPFLLSGPEKIGKKQLALNLAKEFLGFDNNSDLLVIASDQSQILLDQIKQVTRFLNLKAVNNENCRIVLVDNVHFLRNEAANAFLKTLEESNGLIIGITSKPEDILPTIKSRFLEVKILPPSQEEMKELAAKMAAIYNNTCIEPILNYAGCRPGVLIELLENPQIFEKRKLAAQQFKEIFSLNSSERLLFREKLEDPADSLKIWFEQLLSSFYNTDKLDFLSFRQKKDLVKKFVNTLEMIEDNSLNRGRVLDNFLLSLPSKNLP